MAIVIERCPAFGWIAVRDSKVELCTPQFKAWGDLAIWLRKKYPNEIIGVLANDVKDSDALMAARIAAGRGIVWVKVGT